MRETEKNLSGENANEQGKRKRSSLCRYVRRARHRAASANHPAALVSAPGRNERGRDPERAWDSELDAVASSGEAQDRGTGDRTARRHVSAVHGEHGCSPGGLVVPLRRVLHAK